MPLSKEIIFKQEANRVMYFKSDDSVIEGVMKTDGFIDTLRFSAVKIAEMITERSAIMRSNTLKLIFFYT